MRSEGPWQRLAAALSGNGRIYFLWRFSFLMLAYGGETFDFSCSLSHSSCSRVAVNGNEMSDFSCGLSHSLCTKAAVNRGLIAGLAVIRAKKNGGEKRFTRVGKLNRGRKMVPRDRKTRLKGSKSKTQISFQGFVGTHFTPPN